MKNDYCFGIRRFLFILVLSVSCRRDSEASDVAFQKIEICMESLPDTALYLLKISSSS